MGLIAIGDIHGCAASLADLLDQLAPTPDDHLVFIGDYIDRGPDSKGVLDQLTKLARTHTCTFLRGNHEALMLDFLDHQAYELWSINGGDDTLRSYPIAHGHYQLPEAHLAFLRETEPYLDTPDYFFVHAGLKPYLSIADNVRRFGEDVFLWERSHLQAPELAWEKPVVCGHTPQPEPIDRELLLAIDTGCVYHQHPRLGRLTAVRLPERTFVEVPYSG